MVLFKKILDRNPYSINDTSPIAYEYETISNYIIIKWPIITDANITKGIMVITFSMAISYLIRKVDVPAFSNYFFIVLEPSSSGYADPDIFWFYKRINNVIVQSSEIADRVLLNYFSETFIPVSFGASDWVNYNDFAPIACTKKYDAIYVASTLPLKRIPRYLKAIKRIINTYNPNYKACLVCASYGGEKTQIVQLVENAKLENALDVYFDVPKTEVVRLFNESKVNILLSLKEGSSRCLFEGVMCNIPAICLKENIGVNKDYINEFTGMIIPDKALEYALVYMAKHYNRYTPRKWALEHISPEITTQKLLDVISNLNISPVENNNSICYILLSAHRSC